MKANWCDCPIKEAKNRHFTTTTSFPIHFTSNVAVENCIQNNFVGLVYSAGQKKSNVTKLYISLLLCIQLLGFIWPMERAWNLESIAANRIKIDPFVQ